MPEFLKQIQPDALVDMGDFSASRPVRIDLVYAKAGHPENIFKSAIYRADARLWLHRDFAGLVLNAADILAEEHQGAVLVLKDGLRTVEAQEAMQRTPIVRAHPEWTSGPVTFLSAPGMGAHPRGMAVDVGVEGPDGKAWDFGTPFDYFSPDPTINPAGRDYADLADDVLERRRILEDAFTQGAALQRREILPLPTEWWDFRFPAALVREYAPLSDCDLPGHMKMTEE